MDARGALRGVGTRAGAEPRVLVIGYLLGTDRARPRNLAARLEDLGYVEGQNLRFELRYAPQEQHEEPRLQAGFFFCA